MSDYQVCLPGSVLRNLTNYINCIVILFYMTSPKTNMQFMSIVPLFGLYLYMICLRSPGKQIYQQSNATSYAPRAQCVALFLTPVLQRLQDLSFSP